jgi:NADPH:quinone reductase-like Zn-dependent oxidoreductase
VSPTTTPRVLDSETLAIGHGFATAAFTLFHKAHVGLSLSPTPEEAKKPILIWGASTNVGTYGIQVLKFLGYSNILAVASAKHADHLKSIGATAVFDRGSPSIVQDLKTAAGESVPYAAVFSIDEQGWSNLLQTLAPDARFSFIIRNGPPEDKIPSGVKYSRAVVLGLTDVRAPL